MTGDRSVPAAAPLFAIVCPACASHLAAGTDLAGGRVRCPLCTAAFRVPKPVLPGASRATDIPADNRGSAAAAPPAGAPAAAVPAVAGTTPVAARDAVATSSAGAATDDARATSDAAAASGAVAKDEAVAATGPAAEAGNTDEPLAVAVPARPADPDLTSISATLAAARTSATQEAVVPGLGIPADAPEAYRQSEQERSRRRSLKNLVTLVVGAAILIGIALVVGAPRARRRPPRP